MPDEARTEGESLVLDAQHPWPSLQAFREQHSALFKGRDQEIADLVRRVRRRLLTILFGASGLGKTSLLQAGLFPALRREHFLPVLIRLDLDEKGADPIRQVRSALKHEIDRQHVRSGDPPLGEDLWSLFHRRDFHCASSSGEPLTPVLVFDQFEEIFTRRPDFGDAEIRRRQFVGQLTSIVENRPPDALSQAMEEDPTLVDRFDFRREDFRVVISLREDYLPQLEELKKRLPSIMENRLRLVRMSQHEALQAVIGPGREVVSETVAREIVSFVAGSSVGGNGESAAGLRDVDPSLLSLICFELNAQRLSEGLPFITSELLRGRSSRILDEFYSRCFEFLPVDKRVAAQSFVEERLLTPAGHRGTVALESAEAELEAAGVNREALHELVRRRLLQFDERHGLQRVELAHDVLTSVVGRHRDHRHELQALEQLRSKEQHELAEARERETAALAQIKRLRRARMAYAAAGVLFAGLCVLLLLIAGQLRNTRARLLNTNEELKHTNDELKRTNDDLKASNEKVQKANDAVENLIGDVTAALSAEIPDAKGTELATLQRVVKGFLNAFAKIRVDPASTSRLQVIRADMLQAAAKAYMTQNPRTYFKEAKQAANEAISELKGVASYSSATSLDSEGQAQSPAGSASGRRSVLPKLAIAYLTFADVIKSRAEAEPDETPLDALSLFYNEADASYRAAYEVARQAPGGSESDLLCAKSLAGQGDLIKDRWIRAVGLARDSRELADKRQWTENALSDYDKAFQLCSALPQDDKRVISLEADLHNKIGTIYLSKIWLGESTRDQEFESAESHYNQARALRQRLLDQEPDSISEQRSLAYTLNNVARLYQTKLADSHWVRNPAEREKLRTETEKLYQNRLQLAQQISKADPQNFFYQSDLGEAYRHLAELYDKAGNKARALELYQAAVEATHGQVRSTLDELIEAANRMHRGDIANEARKRLSTIPAQDAEKHTNSD